MRSKDFAANLVVIVFLGACTPTIPYSGRVVDAQGRPVGDATVIGFWNAGRAWQTRGNKTRSERYTPFPGIDAYQNLKVVTEVESDGSFGFPTSTKLQAITAVSADGKRKVTINNPAPTGNVIMLR